MKNNFKKNGMIRVRFETEEERAEIIRTLENQCGIPVSERLKALTGFPAWDTKSFDISLRKRKYEYSIQPFIGAAMMSGGIRFYSAEEFLRLAETGFRKIPRFPVFHVPHDGNEFPEELMESVRVSPEEFRKIHETMRDTDVTRMVPGEYRGGDMCVKFPVSRLLCDVERFIGPEEEMEKYGMGFCYERAYDGRRIKNVTEDIRSRTLAWYREHHARMDAICRRHSRILLLDMHSFSDQIVPRDHLVSGKPTPDICIGADDPATPEALTEIVRRNFEDSGFRTAVNDPYSGTFVPGAVMRGTVRCDCRSVMIEVNKRVYCDGEGRSIPEKTAQIAEIMKRILADCVEME